MSLAADPSTGELLTPTFEWPAGVHPAADLFPMMDPLSFSKLVEDIRANGLIEALWLDSDGLLLDGRNRLAACQVTDTPTPTRTYDGDEPTRFVVSLNVNRRHLTTGQLSMLAADALPLLEAEAKRHQGTRTDLVLNGAQSSPRPRSRETAGEMFGVGHASVGRAKRVQQEDPALAAKVREGEMTLHAANAEVETRFKGPMQKLAAATEKHKPSQTADRKAVIKTMSDKGHTSGQIAAELGITEGGFKDWCRANDVPLPPADEVLGRSRRLDANRVIAATVAQAEPSGTTDHIDYSKLDRDLIEGWASSLTQSISSLTTIRNNLRKELSQ